MSDWWQADPIAGPKRAQQSPYAGAISGIESGGRFDAVGPVTRDGDRAYGYTQVMGKNVGPWTEQFFGQRLTPQEFLKNEDAQRAVFNGKFGEYVQKYGPEGAAKAWFAGERGMNNPNARDVLGTSVSDYAAKFNRAAGSTDVGAQSRQPMQILPVAARTAPTPAANWWANDPVSHPTAQQADVPLPRPAPGEMEGPPQAPVNMVQKALEPVTSYPSTYSQMANESFDQMTRGAGQVKEAVVGDYNPGKLLGGVGNAVMGSIGYVASPLNAALRTFAGKPIEENFGVPKELTETALGFVLPIPGAGSSAAIRSTQVPRALPQGERVVQAGENLANVGQSGAVQIPKAVASDSMVTQRAATVAGNAPLVGDPLVKATQGTTKQLATKTQEIAQEYGAANSTSAGEDASAAIKNWITDKSKQAVTKAYDKVDSLVDNSVRTELSETRQVAQSILSRRANANITDRSDAVRRVEEAITNPSGLNYQGVKDLRTYMGEFLDGKKILPADLSTAEVKQIYSGLSKDLRTSVENAGGPKAVTAFERANNYNRLVSDRRESLVKIVGANGDTPAAQVFDRLTSMAGNTTRADMSKLAQARKAMGPEAWNEVASGVIAQMGRVEEATGNVIFSPQRFLTAYNTKLSEPGRALLFRSAGKENIAPFLDDIATISGRFKELQKYSNPSGTAQNLMGGAMFTGLLAEPLTAISTVVGGNLLARTLATPATVAPTAQWVRKYELAIKSPTPGNVAQLTIASRNLANTINAEFGASISAQDLLKAIQGPTKGRTEDEQPKPEGVVN